MGVNVYIGFWALELRSTQYGFCGEVNLQECKGKFFSSEVGHGGLHLLVGFIKVLLGLPKR